MIKRSISFKLLPLTIICALVIMAYRTGQLAHDGAKLWSMMVSNVQAQEAQKKEAEEKKSEEKKTEEKPAEKSADKPTEGSDTKEAKKENTEEKTSEKSADKPAEKKEGAAKEEGKTEEPSKDKKEESAEPATSVNIPVTTETETKTLGGLRPEDRKFSPQELELLQKLSKRREKLEEWDKNLVVKENLLATTEKRVDEKLVQMEDLKKELSAMLVQYNAQEDAKIKSLVSIYENMKPRDAARIFDEVEMPILLLVIDRMAEKKAAPILASMDPKKAKQLTVELAEQRKEQGAKLGNKPANVTAPLVPSPATPAPAAPAK